MRPVRSPVTQGVINHRIGILSLRHLPFSGQKKHGNTTVSSHYDWGSQYPSTGGSGPYFNDPPYFPRDIAFIEPTRNATHIPFIAFGHTLPPPSSPLPSRNTITRRLQRHP